MASKMAKAPSKVCRLANYLPPSPPPADLCHRQNDKCHADKGKTRRRLNEESSTPSPPALFKEDFEAYGAADNLEREISDEPPVLTPDSTPTKSSNCGHHSDSDNSILEEHSYSKASPPPKEIVDTMRKQSDTVCNSKTTAGRKRPAKKRVRSTKKIAHISSPAPHTPVQKKQRRPKVKPLENNTKVTDFFPIRRSNRKTAKQIKREQESNIVEAIRNNSEDGLQVIEFPGKGRGVVSTKPFRQGDFVVEYVGDLINLGTAKDRENEYSLSPETGCYMYYFKHNNKSYCVDATAESGKLGRLLNHSRSGNCCTRVVDIDGNPHLILVAGSDIQVGEELQYDYGDRSKESIEAHPWLAL